MRKKFFRFLLVSAIAISMVFALAACNGNGNGNGDVPDPSPVNPDGSLNLGAPGAVLTATAATEILEDWVETVENSTLASLGAFRLSGEFFEEEMTVSMEAVSNGVNAFIAMEVAIKGDDGSVLLEMIYRRYMHNGTEFMKDGMIIGGDYSDIESFVVFGEFLESLQYFLMDDALFALEVIEYYGATIAGRTYANGTKITLTADEPFYDMMDEVVLVFDNNGRQVKTITVFTEDMQELLEIEEVSGIIVWGGTPTVTAPNPADFVAPSIDIFDDININIYTSGDVVYADGVYTVTIGVGGVVDIYAQVDWTEDSHWTWYKVTFTLTDSNAVEIDDYGIADYYSENNFKYMDTIGAGQVTLTIRSVALPNIYITVIIIVVE
ncbi:MAG: hypothetical protein FWB72_07240 [Firmicutes bacterium]|nr:hypothetical protein [Bacillota bacterium]